MNNVLVFNRTVIATGPTDTTNAQRVVMRPLQQEQLLLEASSISQSADSVDELRYASGLEFSMALIATFAPESYQVTQPLPISIYSSQDGYTASFFDANIHTTGDNQQEAFDNIKSLILDMFDGLMSRCGDDLGPGPKRQLKILEQFVVKIR